MSWFQNLFQRLKKDEEDEEFNGYILHKHEGLPLLNKHENLKDLDTKVSYQYPKSSYRPSYPPIPRETQKEKEETLRQKRLEKLPEKRKSREKPEIQTVKKEVPKTKIEPLPRKSGPFQPTEIPSPVFGFNRPRNTKTLVEHELSHFLNEKIEKELESLVVSKETIADPEINIPFVNEEELLEDLIEASPVSIESKEEVKEAIAVSFESTEAVNEYIAVSIEPPEEVIESIALSKEPPEEVKENIAVSIESPEAEEEEVSEAIPEPPEPKRSNLPFNVMMLKQDKQKWEERKRKRTVDQQDEVPTVNKQPEKGNQVIDLFPVKEKESTETTDEGYYTFPTDGLLNPPVTVKNDTKWLLEQEEILNETLQNFNVGASVVNVTQGPSVTRFEVQPEPGVKVNKITNLSDDIKLSLAARDIRIEAPIPGKHTIGIEVPNQKSRPVFINEIIQSSIFKESTSPLTAVLGLDIAGKPIVTDLKKMPHGLIAGATGSGKSVCINTILVSLLFKASPEDLKLLLIDPKMVELAPYNRIPHLVSPVITDVKAATAALKWAVEEMERRYELFAHTGVRDINRFNELAIKHKQYSDKLPFIVIVIDELADLMMMSPADVEEAICRIAQKARACGIHLIVATQRPSVDVITGLIKANIPTRIAFSVSSQVDSRTIIDISGAEKLLGRGDMLFLENGSSKPVRLQGTFVSDEEIDLVVGHVREQREPDYLFEQDELLKKAQVTENEDELFYEACEFIIDQGGASTSSLQRRFKIGYNRAARLMDLLENSGYITSANGSKAREVLITLADLESIQDASANN
ncbi:DNA translocase FtsK [Neobacillus drentensis]|uniref:DNA translocase FtsK n=1 Tax=Neobacillus drentensis TaxID=220684 RepID=UPI0009EF3552|nr:DNA translocase FtsK [Neobacillus drentensis]